MLERWSPTAANDWYQKLDWLLGCNYTPRTAINQLEMWQPQTFDPTTIDQELGWAAAVGMNTARVFLHDLAWAADAGGFLDRIDQFLAIAARHGIGVMLVFFDSCWHPFPHAGRQPQPEPGVHNSGWMQSPGVAILRDESAFDRLGDYVTGVVRRFADDPRVLVWDAWNEPENPNTASRGCRDMGEEKAAVAAKFLPKVFSWIRAAHPSQPSTSGIWNGNWASDATLKPLEQVQLEQSDVISFHCYGDATDMEKRIGELSRYGRPLLCTEYMARGAGSTFEAVLPLLKSHRVAAYQWGLVAGKSQTHYPWDSWQRPYPPEPPIWFHDLFRADGSPYRPEEIDLLRQLAERPSRTVG